MKLYIKQKVFSIGERFYVKDEYGTDVLYVEGSFFRIPKMFTVYDMQGDQLATIERQMFRLMPHFDITTQNENITIKKDFTFFYHQFSIINSDWTLQGDFLAHEYSLLNGGTPIMALSKHWFTWGDSYELDIQNESDALISLCIAIAIDAETTGQSNTAAASSN